MKTRKGLGKIYNARQHFCYVYDRFELLNLKKKKLFCAFIDVGKMFDTEWRDGLSLLAKLRYQNVVTT